MRAFLFWIVPCGGGCSDSRSASIITCAMCSCSSISTDKPAGQIHAIPTSVWFGSLLNKAFYLLSKSTAAALLKRERGFLSFPSCWNPHEIIGAEVVKCVFSLQVIQIKLSRPVMYRLLHTEFFPFGQLIPITGSSIVRVNFSYLWFLSLGWETHSGQFFKCRIRYLQEGAHNWSLQGMYYSQQAHFKFEYVLNFLSIY